MAKVLMGPSTLIYPMPALLVGANVEGNPNFMAVAWSGIVNSTPPMISVALNYRRHTLIGVKQTLNSTLISDSLSPYQIMAVSYPSPCVACDNDTASERLLPYPGILIIA